MIKKSLIYLFVTILLIIPRPVKAELEINILEDTTLKPGELKIVKINIKNTSNTKQTISPELELPKNWKLIIPLNGLTIGPKRSKKMNILLQSPKIIRAAIYPLNLLLKTSDKDYNIEVPVKIKEIFETDVKVVKAPRYIEEEFAIKLRLINKGNTSRRFKIVSNNIVAIDKAKIFLNSFESKIITLNCRIREYESEEIGLNIRAVDEFKKSISLFNDKVIILEPDRNFKKYESHLNFRVVKKGNESQNYWGLKTLLDKKSFLEVGNDYFNYYRRNRKTRWQFGTEYLDRIKLKELSGKNNNVKTSYEFSPNNKFKNIVYTDFTNEIGVGFSKHLEHNFYYLELKNNKYGRIDYYFNTSIRKENYQFNYKRYKLKENNQINSFLRYEMNKNNNLKASFNKVSSTKITNKKYLRYNHQGINKRITIDYAVLKRQNKNSTMWRLSRKDIDIIGDYFLYSSLKFKKIVDKWKPEFKLTLQNNNNKFLIKKDYKKRYGLEFQKNFKYKHGKFQVGINNYGSTKFNINAKNEFIINGKEIYFTGNLSYDSNNSFKIKKIKLGINLPFTVKLEKRHQNKVAGKIRGDLNNLEGLILDINGQKVKTEADGSFTAYIPSTKRISIKGVDLGRYTGKYLLRPNLPYLIENYSGGTIFLDLIKYGNLKLTFTKSDYENNPYLKAITNKKKQEKGRIILYNNQHTFLKEFKGEKEIILKNIPPGQYVIKMENKSTRYNYKFKNKNIEIRPGDNQISIEKYPLNEQGLKIEEEIEKIKIIN